MTLKRIKLRLIKIKLFCGSWWLLLFIYYKWTMVFLSSTNNVHSIGISIVSHCSLLCGPKSMFRFHTSQNFIKNFRISTKNEFNQFEIDFNASHNEDKAFLFAQNSCCVSAQEAEEINPNLMWRLLIFFSTFVKRIVNVFSRRC